jgi:hypothetical protein
MGLTFDSASGNIVLFGGGQNSDPNFRDTWLYNGTTWTEVTPVSSPPGRADVSMTYDPVRDRVVLFGGAEWGGVLNAETWEFDGTSWSLMTPPNAPSARRRSALAYDSLRDRTLLFGGFDSIDGLRDTWEYDGSDWTAISTTSSPPSPIQLGAPAMIYDLLRRRMVLVTPNATSSRIETWTLHMTSTWPDEDCTAPGDEDMDGLTDCADPDCEGLPCATGRCSSGVCQ